LATGAKHSDGYIACSDYGNSSHSLIVGWLMNKIYEGMTDQEAAAYDAPFPSIDYKAGVRRFPQMVMIEPGMEGVDTSIEAVNFWREQWQGQTFMAIGEQDPVLGVEVMQRMAGVIRGCPPPMIIKEAGHFVQELGDQVATAALESFAKG